MRILRCRTRPEGTGARVLPARKRQQAFTLAELMITSSVATLVLGSVMVLLLQTAMEHRRGLAEATLEQEVGGLQNGVLRILRSMSAEQGAIASDPVTTGQGSILGFRRVVVARGSAPEFPREAVFFDANTRRVIHDPNLAMSGDEQVLMESRPGSYVLRDVYFLPSIKSDSTPDPSLLNIVIELDDDGFSASARPGSTNVTTLLRTFTVKMRNL